MAFRVDRLCSVCGGLRIHCVHDTQALIGGKAQISPTPRSIVDELRDVLALPAGTGNSDINVVAVAVPVYVVQAAIAEIKRLQGQVDSLQDSQYWSCE